MPEPNTPLANLLSGYVSPNRAALEPPPLALGPRNPFDVPPIPDPLDVKFSDALTEGATSQASDFVESPETAATLGTVFSNLVQLPTGVALAAPFMDAATSNEPETIWTATQNAMSTLNPLSKVQKVADALTPEVKPIEPTPTPAADVLAPATNRPKVDATWGDINRPDLIFEGVGPKHFTPGQFGRLGEAFGAHNIGPLDEEKWYASLQPFTSADGSKTFYIPGGINDKTPFSYWDDLYMKSQGINPAELDEKTRTAIHNRTVAGKGPPPEGFSDANIVNQFQLGMTSPNNPLTPNEFAVAASMVKGPEDIGRLAASSSMDFRKSSNYLGTQGAPAKGTTGTPYSEADRQARSLDIIDKVGAGAGERGGLGVGGSADWTRISDMAQMVKEKPEFFRFRGADEGGRTHEENWANFVDRIITQVPGLKAKTGSFSSVWQDPAKAGISALDRHMLAIIRDNVFDTPEAAAKWNTKAIKKWNDSVTKYNKNPENKVKRKPITSVDDLATTPGGTDYFNEEMFKVVNNPKETTIRDWRTGDVSTKVSPHLRPEKADYVAEPLKTVEISPSYKRGLTDVAKKGAREGSTGLFSDQWYLWDPQRQRFEPHEIMQPGLADLPRMSHQQLKDALAAHSEAGYLNYTKDAQGKLQPVSPIPFNADEALTPARARMKEALRGLDPSKLAAFAATGAAAAGLVSEELLRREQEGEIIEGGEQEG